MQKKTYSERLLDGRWQMLRLEVLNRDKFTCVRCGAQAAKGATMHVHHKQYFSGFLPWQYDPKYLETLCAACHKKEHFPEPTKDEPKPKGYDQTEADLLRLLFMNGKAPMIPANPNQISRRYENAFDFIITELIRFGIKMKSPEFQEMYDTIASNYYNTPDYIPDIEQFLTSENPAIQRFARFTVETAHPVSPGWAERFGINLEPKPADISRNVVNVTIAMIFQHLQAIKTAEINKLATADEKDVLAIQKSTIEINKVIQSLIAERGAWNG